MVKGGGGEIIVTKQIILKSLTKKINHLELYVQMPDPLLGRLTC